MKNSVVVLTIFAVFFFLASAVYLVWNLLATGVWEPIGTIAIALSGVLAAFIGFFLNLVNRSQGGILLPEDRDADIDEGDPELGHFSPWSWWPFMIGVGLFLFFLGLAVGFWICFIGAPFVLIAITGWVYEYYRGYFAH
ncbi:MAG: hypothetical protein RLZZ600_756 [Actinomycetota bacterium]|jgi:hypothetical protein